MWFTYLSVNLSIIYFRTKSLTRLNHVPSVNYSLGTYLARRMVPSQMDRLPPPLLPSLNRRKTLQQHNQVLRHFVSDLNESKL